MRLFICAALTLFTCSASAQNYEPLLSLKDGQTILNLSASERTEVRQDELSATLVFTTDHKDPRIVQDTINKAMSKAIKESEKYQTLQVSTLGYNVYEYDPNRNKRNAAPAPIWRGEQSLLIKGTDSDKVLELSQKLQNQGLIIKSLGFNVSSDLREKTHNNLMEAALEALEQKAQRAGKALGKDKVSFLQVDVDDVPLYSTQPRMMMASRMEKGATMDMAAPVAAAGYSDISLTVRATILIAP